LQKYTSATTCVKKKTHIVWQKVPEEENFLRKTDINWNINICKGFPRRILTRSWMRTLGVYAIHQWCNEHLVRISLNHVGVEMTSGRPPRRYILTVLQSFKCLFFVILYFKIYDILHSKFNVLNLQINRFDIFFIIVK
jgi:hypothetical protein